MNSSITSRRSKLVAPCLVILSTCVVAPVAIAEDYFLTIGGGYSVTGNQLSLERNVIFQQGVLAAQRPDGPRHDVFFADGDDTGPEVQCRDPLFYERCPPARRIMAELFSDEDSMDLVYRNNEIASLAGPSDLSLVKRRMREISRQIKPHDRLIIYVTGHGGEAEQGNGDDYDYEYDEASQSWKANANEDESEREYNRYDTSFYLWNSESVSASEFATWLDRMPRETHVVLVMVQCFAGGFAHTIFQQADAELGLSPHARCGFFAQVHDRGAAGCTPDANEADYEEYSSYFWGALGGKTRTGQAITSADYNDDGRVSFAEAHTYAVIESKTIDVPVRTSDALLRHYSQLRKQPKETESSDDNPVGRLWDLLGSKSGADGKKDLMDAEGTIAKLMDTARPDQRAILAQLPAKLGLEATSTVEDVKQKLGQVKSKLNVANAKLATAVSTQSTTLERVQEEVRELWPELHSDNSPSSMALTSERAEEFVETVTALPSYESLVAAGKRVDEFAEEQLQLSRDEARLQRLVNTCEAVALAANLPRIAPAEIVTRYQQLVAMEDGTLVAGAETGDVSQSADTTTRGARK
jgi:hypothetical protein